MLPQKKLREFRVVIALLVIIGELVLFADVKGKLPAGLFQSIHYLHFIPSILSFISPGTIFSAGFIIILLLTVFSGRVYCSFFCPLGIMQDLSGWIRQKLVPKKKNRFMKAKTVNVLRYSILAVGLISLFFSGILFLNLLDPYANFGRMASNVYQPVLLWVNNLLAGALNSRGSYLLIPIEPKHTYLPALLASLFVLLLVFVFSILKGRLYCNTICPVGAFLGLISKLSFYKMKIDHSSCSSCGKCQQACKSNCIDIKTLTVDETRCVSCFNCLSDCEEGSIAYKKSWVVQKHNPGATDNSKRDFLKTTAVSLLAISGLNNFLMAEPNHKDGSGHGHGKRRRRFWNRGIATPPGSLSLTRFKDKCVACHLCISVCPGNVLQPTFLEYGLKGIWMPKMDYALGFCKPECIKCGEVCPTGAVLELPVEVKKLTQLGEVAFAKQHCIVETEGAACGACAEHCPTQAVRMLDYMDDLTIPEINPLICVGCGACEYACPVEEPHKAIFVMPIEVHVLVEKPKQEVIEVEEIEAFPF